MNKQNEKGVFNTSAQVKTWEQLEPNEINMYGLFGNGANLDSKKLVNWAKRKTISVTIILRLIMISEKKKRDKKFIQSLWNAYHCLEKVYTVNDRLYGNYCKNKLCSICNGIKKSKMISTYLPILKTWKEPHFVTLTIKSVYKYKLNEYLYKGMNRGFRKILQKNSRQVRAGKQIKIIGVRSLECNYNPIKRWYNPHFHVLVPDKETAKLLVQEWVKICSGLALPKNQKIRKVNDLEADLIEVIKYGTKIFTDPTMKKEEKKKKLKDYKIYLSAYENIIHSFHNTRRHEHFGFKLNKRVSKPKSVDFKKNLKAWEFNPKNSNWSEKTNKDKLLVNGPIDFASIETVKSIIDVIDE